MANTDTEQGNPASVSVDALRDQVLKRLAGVQQSLEGKGVGAAFLRAAKADPVGDMGAVGGLITNMILGGVFSDFLEAHLHIGHPELWSHFNEMLASGFEDLSAAEETNPLFAKRKLSAYPQGRRKRKVDIMKKFNRISANRSGQFTPDVQRELGSLYEILDILGSLEDQGTKTVSLKQPDLKRIGNALQKSNVAKALSVPALSHPMTV